MSKASNRADLDHTPENADKVGKQHKQANQKGEQPRHPAAPEKDGKHEDDQDANRGKP